MAAPTVSWTHQTLTALEDGGGYAFAQMVVPSGMKFFGGWAESCKENGVTEITAHYSCTPSSFGDDHNYGTADHPIIGSFVQYDAGTDTTYVNIGFKCDPGQQIRAHVFTVS